MEEKWKEKLDLPDNPYLLFEQWFLKAKSSDIPRPEAMALACASTSGTPSVRIILHKGIEEGDFLFYTNYGGRKAQEIEENGKVALVFYWDVLYLQVRIEGQACFTSRAISESYFETRSRESQLHAWASPQDQVIPGYSFLEERVKDLQEKFKGKEVPCPPFWGGIRVTPSRFEFWEGRQHRLHHRFLYQKEDPAAAADEKWSLVRLAP